MSFKQRLLSVVVGNRAAYRLGRLIYHNARGECADNIMQNGERLVQRCVINAWEEGQLKGERLTVFDVGANIGDWTSSLLGVLPDGKAGIRIYLFEPIPATFESLKKRFANPKGILQFEQTALSSVSGESVMYVSGQHCGTNSLHEDSLGLDKTAVGISRITAGEFCRTHGISKVHLLKCDAEGHDMEVIRGALPLLAAESILVFQFEYNWRWTLARNFLRDVFVELKTLPYKVAKLQSRQLLVFNQWHPEMEQFIEGNYLLIHDSVQNWFPVKHVLWDQYNTMEIC